MSDCTYPNDIYTEPEDLDHNTLANLGPLRGMAGIWEGKKGVDVKPEVQGPASQEYVEHYELQPIDPQTNGPQVFYGLRYHTHIVKPGEVEMYHDQVGYFLWEPATGTVIQTLAIPRGQIAMALGHAAADARSFELAAVRGSEVNGICSNPFIERSFTTAEYRFKAAINADGSWSYEQTTVLMIRGTQKFDHTDRNTLHKLAEPTPNPLARG
jgi:hypothetical protein